MSIDLTPDVTSSLSERVAEEIRALLARRRVKQSQLARELKVSEQWLSVRLRGVQPIDLNDLQRIAAALGVSYADLLPPNEPRDGRTVVVAGDSRRQTTVPKPEGHRQHHPFGQPHHAVPKPSTRRPVRLVPAHA